ncbi:TRAP transporter large permease subunit [Xanthobacter sp. KR7-65]|uniref:TRAP transporter large permease n=1 Tax=Xanthobacter sp. KR7-65 TaxID=3156612 RepID=UPI0032B5FF40
MTATAVFMFGGLMGLMLVGVPVAFALFAIAISTLLMAGGGDWSALGLVPSTIWDSVTNFTLTAVPLYILMGAIIAASGMGARLYSAIATLSAGLPGSLAVATTIACAVMAAISGSSVATAAAIGRFSVSEMRRFGYRESDACGAVAAGGTLGILIPPSIPMIVYGVIAEESVGKLFMAGILPGLLLALLFGGYQMWLARTRVSTMAQSARMGPVSLADRARALVEILPMAALIAIILGSIYTGIATPTETAAIGVAVSLLLALGLYRELDWRKCRMILMETGRGSIMVLAIIAGAMLFGYALTTTDVAPTLSRAVAGADLPPWLVFIAINLLLLFLGCFLETLSIIVITTPIIIPIIETFGWDKVWFGVILMINMEMALITPPVGLNLFVVKGVVPEVPLGRIIAGTLPYVLIMALALALVAVLPQVFI